MLTGPYLIQILICSRKILWLLTYIKDIIFFITRCSFLAFEVISKELKQLTPQIQHLRKNLRQRSKYCKKQFFLKTFKT